MTDYSDLLTETSRRKENVSYADMLMVEVEPERIGGTFREKPGGEISTITGKREQEFIPGVKPFAGFGTQLKASFVDDPFVRAKVFAESRGIPISRYRINKRGQVEFKTDEGTWQREVAELPLSKFESFIAGTIAHPSTYLAPLGAALGVKGAVGGAIAGELIRKGIGKTVFGEKIKLARDLTDVAMMGVFALAGEAAGKVISGGINKTLGRKIGILKRAGAEVKQAALTPQDHAKAMMIKQLAEQHNIQLAPHQLYDREGLTTMWKYLRRHPVTADKVRVFEDSLANATDEAIDKFIRNMGGYEKTAYQIGEEITGAAEKVITGLEKTRRKVVDPLYEKAFKMFGRKKVDTSRLIKEIDTTLKKSVSQDPGHKILTQVRAMILEAKGDPKKLHRIKVEAIDRVLGKYMGVDPFITRDAMIVKNRLRRILETQVKGYKGAQEAFARLTDPIKKLKTTIIGELAGVSKTMQQASKWHKLIDAPDAILIREAKKEIETVSQETWRRMVGRYIADVYENLKVTEEGRLLNVAGKMHKRLFGSKKQREIMRAALDTKEYKALSDLMIIFERAAIGTRRESMTAQFQAVGRQLGEIPGSKIYRYALFPRQATVETLFGKWNDLLVSGRQKQLLDALIAPDVTKKLASMRKLTPGSKKMIESLAVLTTMVAERMSEETP